MAGLTDSTTGLEFGQGLQWQTPIGGAGLIISTDPGPGIELMTDDGLTYLLSDDSALYLTEDI